MTIPPLKKILGVGNWFGGKIFFKNLKTDNPWGVESKVFWGAKPGAPPKKGVWGGVGGIFLEITYPKRAQKTVV